MMTAEYTFPLLDESLLEKDLNCLLREMNGFEDEEADEDEELPIRNKYF
jgi:hypothetical protein